MSTEEVHNKFRTIYQELDTLCHNSEISRTEAFNEQVMYILFARLLDCLDGLDKKNKENGEYSLFPPDLMHLKWKHILNAQPEEQMRLINGLPTRKEQESWSSCPWMNMFQFFRSGLKKTYLKEITKCFQDVECRLTNPSILSGIIKCVDEMPINEGEFKESFYSLMTILTKVRTSHIEFSDIFQGVIGTSPYINLIADLAIPSSGDSVCDPICGNGTLLTKIALTSSQNHKLNTIKFYGFDTDIFSTKLTAINILFNNILFNNILFKNAIDNPNIFINCLNPLDRLSKFYLNYTGFFDKVVAIPPFGHFLDTEIVPDELEQFSKIQRSEILYLGLTEHILKPKGLGVICIPSINLIGTKTQNIREQLVEQNQLEAVIFFSFGRMEHAVLVFKKGDTTDSSIKTENVLFYRIPKKTENNDENSQFFNIWKNWRQNPVSFDNRRDTIYFTVPKAEIASHRYILAFEKYQDKVYEPSNIREPNELLEELNKEGKEIRDLLIRLNQELTIKNE